MHKWHRLQEALKDKRLFKMGVLLEESKQFTSVAEKGYDTTDFVGDFELPKTTLHVVLSTSNWSLVIDKRTALHVGYMKGLTICKRIERVHWLG